MSELRELKANRQAYIKEMVGFGDEKLSHNLDIVQAQMKLANDGALERLKEIESQIIEARITLLDMED